MTLCRMLLISRDITRYLHSTRVLVLDYLTATQPLRYEIIALRPQKREKCYERLYAINLNENEQTHPSSLWIQVVPRNIMAIGRQSNVEN